MADSLAWPLLLRLGGPALVGHGALPRPRGGLETAVGAGGHALGCLLGSTRLPRNARIDHFEVSVVGTT